jgi:hypothetical protein
MIHRGVAEIAEKTGDLEDIATSERDLLPGLRHAVL